MEENKNKWSEENSRYFIDYGNYIVPEREIQIDTVSSLIKPVGQDPLVLDICCGEGLLAEAILNKYPECTVTGLDGSEEMLEASKTRLKSFGKRFIPAMFDLNTSDWRNEYKSISAVVSSLAIHHLSGEEKKKLYKDVYSILVTGGSFIIADIVFPASEIANNYAADTLDEIIKKRSLELDGTASLFEEFERLKWNYFKYPDEMDMPSTISEHLLWLKEAGFTGVDVFWLKAGHAVYGGFKK